VRNLTLEESCSEVVTRRTREKRDTAIALTGKRVLIVEDDGFIAMNIADELRADGAEVVGPVHNVDAALKLITTTSLDGAVLDVKLMGQPVFRVADELADRHIPFVFQTG
jgi:DNA-binding response OmpR family regulator